MKHLAVHRPADRGTYPPPAGTRHLTSPQTQAWLFVVLVCACVLGLTSWRLERAYNAQIEAGRVTTVNLARSLADHAHAAVHGASTILAGVAERLQNDGRSDEAMVRLHHLLVRFVAASPGIADVVAFSATGDGLATSLEPMPRVNVADRSYFVFHRDHPGTMPLVGAPLRNRADGRWVFTVSRRVDNADGSFGGVVVALIECDWFVKFYSNFDVGSHGAIWLANDDAMLLVRYPPVPDLVGKTFDQAPAYLAYREHGPVGTTRVISALDGAARISGFRKVDEFPLAVWVSIGEDDILGGWRNDAIISTAVAVAISALLGVLGWRLVVLFRVRDRKDLALRRSERQYRMLADHSTDVILQLGPDGRHRYVSPACERLLGYHPLGVPGRPPARHRPSGGLAAAGRQHRDDPDHRARPAASATACAAKTASTSGSRRRGQKLDGEAGVVVALRDISSRKRVEALLHEANNHLQRQVMLDGLTCIANRRCFDLTLSKEFRRAGRDQTPLGLLMIDVDHFKAYNDKYGHPAGDRCLRAIAEAVAQELRRPGDFVARYGGEEFAVLLPNTNEAGRHGHGRTAPRHRACLGDPPCRQPRPDRHRQHRLRGCRARPSSGDGGTALLQRADAALYQAKSAGRNRACGAAEDHAMAEASAALP